MAGNDSNPQEDGKTNNIEEKAPQTLLRKSDENLKAQEQKRQQQEQAEKDQPAKEEEAKEEGDKNTTPSQDDPHEQGEDDAPEEPSYETGEMVTLVRVRFPGHAKSVPFTFGERKFRYGQKVIAQSDRGLTLGYINSFPYTVPFHPNMHPLRSIQKAATEEDIAKQQSFFAREKEAEKACIRLIEELKLDMNLTHVEFMQFGKKAVFYFTAPARVDFRELVKKLVTELKMRIELRQISVRDRAAAIGAIGACGLQTCCSSFLRHYGNVSIKMAKNQNLALIPTKINGVCGQLKCCIKYEDQVYTDKRKKLPKEQSFIQAANGDRGKVLRLHVLIEQFEMLTDQGRIRRYAVNQYDPEKKLPKDWRFPKQFDHITSETSDVIGLESPSAKKETEAHTYYEWNDKNQQKESGQST